MGQKTDTQSLLSAVDSEKSPAWKPGGFRKFPYFGFGALLAYLATAAAVVFVLLDCDEQITDTWTYPPNTYISILAILMNLFLSIAFAEGLALSYWRRYCKGSTVAGIHYHWNAGQSFAGACEGILRGFGLLNGLAFIAWALSSARSPMNQNAVGFIPNVPYDTSGSLHLEVASRLPDGYTGQTTYSRTVTADTSALTRDFSNIMLNYSNRQALIINHNSDECGDSCDTTVNSFGFLANCTTDVGPVVNMTGKSSSTFWTIFSTGVAIWGDYEKQTYYAGLNLTSSYQSNKTGTQQYYTRNCLLQPSTMEYPITLTRNNTVALRSSWDKDRQVKLLDYLGPSSRQPGATTIGGFQLAMSTLFGSSATFNFGGAVSSIQFAGTVVNQYVDTANSGSAYTWPTYVNWNDPTDDILNAIREVAFRASIYAATDPSLNRTALNPSQDVDFTGTVRKTIYKINRRYMAAGAALALLGFFGVLPLYYGWWQLGRRVTMSPIEIAKSFDSRMLADLCEHDASGLARAGKTLKIRYALANEAGA
ncbi:hypothetical protein IWZ00DRAFT_283601 [Phyllosticta capitalensis]|uniref:Uncharacterized protein n=1 Tax=Phyllosticta capitalensis TaxID=121624 RepID=A0ABR1YQX7_9PEZI